MRKTKPASHRSFKTSPWIIIGSVVILLSILIVMALQNYSREKKYMSSILSEKGVAIIKAVEAGTRTGMMGMQWKKQQIQTLLEETAQLPDVFFLSVVDKDGFVLAHSDKSRIGSLFFQNSPLFKLNPTNSPSWQLIEIDSYGRSFLVYSYFNPISDNTGRMHRGMGCTIQGNGMTKEQWRDSYFCSGNGEKTGIIIVGLNPKPFDEARHEDIRNTVIISVVLMILGLAGFISLFWMQSYHSTKQELQDTSAFADEIVANLPVGLIATNKDGKIAFYNNAVEHIIGTDLSNALGKLPEDLSPNPLRELQETLTHGEAVSEKEMECEFTEGKIVPVSINASKIINEKGQFVGQILILKDLGEVRQLQAEVRRKEKLAAIGDLAAGVAHEIRNPLSSIKGIASYYKNKFQDSSEDKEMAGVMIEEVDRLNRVISELLEFARPTELNFKSSDMNALVEYSVRLVRQEAITKNIDIQLNLFPSKVLADVDPDRLTQCLLNLYLNAIQAMESGGKLIIMSASNDDDTVRIEVKDSGSGIRSEDVSKIFDPYFTTKSKGTGLGLAIVHKIIEAHQGLVKVRSSIEQGTVFSIILPMKQTR